MQKELKQIIAVVGHYGSGKTNFALNLALAYSRRGEQVILADLDVVNPYFRSADYAALVQAQGIELVTPLYAGSNLDIPALTARFDAAIDSGKRVILDVGGDDAGAAALGRYTTAITEQGGCELLYVINGYRYLTRTAEEAGGVLEQIEAVCRLPATGIINCSNLGEETTAQTIVDSAAFADEVSARYQLPVLAFVAPKSVAEEAARLLPERVIYPVEIYVKKPWEA